MSRRSAENAALPESVSELCDHWDREFVTLAYQALLGRAPDPEGEAHYLTLLRTGVSKMAILQRLRASLEGRQSRRSIAGLDRAIRKHRAASRRYSGWLVRLVTGREGNSASQRMQRALANNLAAFDKVLSASAASQAVSIDRGSNGSIDVRRDPDAAGVGQGYIPLHLRMIRIEAALQRIEAGLRFTPPVATRGRSVARRP